MVSMEVKTLRQYIEHLVGTKSAVLLGATSMQKPAEADGSFSVAAVASSVYAKSRTEWYDLGM